MKAGRWREIEALFHRLADAPPAEREAVLRDAEPGLRLEVEKLLGSDGRGAQTVAQAVSEGTSLLDASTDTRFGPWQASGRLGEGGMGVVYRGFRADHAFQKEVAIKVLRLGLDTPYARERFFRERQILATLDHPHIARLLDGGETSSGLPYLVLDYVKGDSIVRYAERHRLDRDARLRLFLHVCEAVQFAHRNLIIHRDLKPGNILVDEEGSPKLLDFGIAKLAGAEADVTRTGLRALTPQYASPEQVRGGPITTASDVYSLGVVLYELLTGRQPYIVAATTPGEIERAICESEPAPANLGSDLDNILRMAMRKEPERRYASAQDLASDLERTLRDLPVLARPDTVRYRAGKFVRRHKLSLAAGIAVALSLGVGAGIAIREGRLAQERFEEVRGLARAVLFDVHDEITKVPGSLKAREKILEVARQYLDRLAVRAGNDVGLITDLALAYRKVGDALGGAGTANLGKRAEALQSYEKARDLYLRGIELDRGLRKPLTDVYQRIGRLRLGQGQTEAALLSLKESTRLAGELVKEDPTSKQLAKEAARAWRSMGFVHEERDDWEQAAACHRLALDLLRPFASEKDVRIPLHLSELDMGDALLAMGDLPAAKVHYGRSVAFVEEVLREAPNDPSNLRARLLLYDRQVRFLDNPVKLGFDDPAAALPLRRADLAGWIALRAKDPENLDSQLGVASGLYLLARTVVRLDPAEGVARMRESLALLEELRRQRPNHGLIAARRRNAYLTAAQVMVDAGKPDAALSYLETAWPLWKEHSGASAHGFSEALTMALLHQIAAEAHARKRQWPQAERNLAQARQWVEGLAGREAARFEALNPIARVYEQSAGLEMQLGHPAKAAEWQRKALAVWDRWPKSNAHVTERRRLAESRLRMFEARLRRFP